jgi:PII-like signaling protein
MKIEGEAQLVRIFVGEDDRHEGKPLFQAIVELARREGLAGATVLKGVAGFGANSRIHAASILRLSEDLPIVIEIVDQAEKIAKVLPALDALLGEGLITLEKVRVIAYRHSKK